MFYYFQKIANHIMYLIFCAVQIGLHKWYHTILRFPVSLEVLQVSVHDVDINTQINSTESSTV